VPYVRLCVVKLYVLLVYSARVPASLGTAVPRRGALSIAAGVKLPAALTERMIERRRETSARGDFVRIAILNIALKMVQSSSN